LQKKIDKKGREENKKTVVDESSIVKWNVDII
jgi:hypothetical protein